MLVWELFLGITKQQQQGPLMASAPRTGTGTSQGRSSPYQSPLDTPPGLPHPQALHHSKKQTHGPAKGEPRGPKARARARSKARTVPPVSLPTQGRLFRTRGGITLPHGGIPPPPGGMSGPQQAVQGLPEGVFLPPWQCMKSQRARDCIQSWVRKVQIRVGGFPVGTRDFLSSFWGT